MFDYSDMGLQVDFAFSTLGDMSLIFLNSIHLMPFLL